MKKIPKRTKTAKAGKAGRGGRKPGRWTHLTQDSLRQFRDTAKLSRTSLAQTLGVSSGSIMNWETGRAVPIKRYQLMLAELIAGGGTVPADRDRGTVPADSGPKGRSEGGAVAHVQGIAGASHQFTTTRCQ